MYGPCLPDTQSSQMSGRIQWTERQDNERVDLAQERGTKLTPEYACALCF